jgi:pimeloyl-ACP methyl ester carboxylesterase
LTSPWQRVAATALAAAGAAIATGVVVERQVVRTRRAAADEAARLVAVRGDVHPVRTEDGLTLHAEVDEAAPYAAQSAPSRRGLFGRHRAEATLVFVHGFALNLDSWHFQRQFFRGKHRLVFYDQRSHGRSERSDLEHATFEQLGRDLERVLDHLAPEGPVVLVGHSMGGMTIIALAEHRPELFGDRVAGVALISTTAGGLSTSRIVAPVVPGRLGGELLTRVTALLAKAPELVDSARTRGSNIGYLLTGQLAFGSNVPAAYVEAVDQMLASTPMDVLLEFVPQFDLLDKFDAVKALAAVPTLVACGTKDRLTTVGHSRKLKQEIPGARLVEYQGAGHILLFEEKDRLNTELATLVTEALGE